MPKRSRKARVAIANLGLHANPARKKHLLQKEQAKRVAKQAPLLQAGAAPAAPMSSADVARAGADDASGSGHLHPDSLGGSMVTPPTVTAGTLPSSLSPSNAPPHPHRPADEPNAGHPPNADPTADPTAASVLANVARAEARLRAVHARMRRTFGEIALPTWVVPRSGAVSAGDSGGGGSGGALGGRGG